MIEERRHTLRDIDSAAAIYAYKAAKPARLRAAASLLEAAAVTIREEAEEIEREAAAPKPEPETKP
jgi:hypothetical protein